MTAFRPHLHLTNESGRSELLRPYWLLGSVAKELLIRPRNFVSPSIMEKVKERMSKLKEAINVCDEHKNKTENSLTKARLRFEMAESEKASLQRMIQLLKLDLEKTVDRGEKKQTELDSLQCKTTQDELVVRELESLEVDGDEKLETLNVMVKGETNPHTKLMLNARLVYE